MGYQFIHVECYARVAGAGKAGGRTLRDVVGEAERRPGDCPHVAAPLPPVVLFGGMPGDAAAVAEERAATAKDASGRKFRRDGLCLLGGVASFPDPWETIRENSDARARWQAWETATVTWPRAEYGTRLVSVVRHEDEARPHLHFYAVPDLGADGRLRIGDVHAGRRAADDAKASGAAKGDQNATYKTEMREYQRRYWEAVSLGHGLTRLGPGRRRLTRSEWQAEQVSAAAAEEALRMAQDAAQRQAHAVEAVERAKIGFSEARAGLAKARAAAEAAEAARRRTETEARSKARSILSEARAEGRRLVGEAEARAAPLRRLGGLFGALWSGFRGIERKLNAIAAAQVAAAQKAATDQVTKAKEELHAEARQAVTDELAELRRTAKRADWERQDAEKRAAKAEAVVRSKTEELRQVTTALTSERLARRSAEAEREKFRARWAEADNALIALRQPSTGPRPRP